VSSLSLPEINVKSMFTFCYRILLALFRLFLAPDAPTSASTKPDSAPFYAQISVTSCDTHPRGYGNSILVPALVEFYEVGPMIAPLWYSNTQR
jgi:hypothetical protein